MDSEKKEITTPVLEEESRLCDQCHQFFGAAHTNYLCSKCYRENQQKQESAVTTLASMPVKQIPEEEKCEKKEVIEIVKEEPKQVRSDSESQVNKNRCWKCSKKVGLIGFECKCGFVFCSKHRHVEDHDCQHDYFVEAQAHLKKNNPVVNFEKVSKI